jgi:hypothetical protein
VIQESEISVLVRTEEQARVLKERLQVATIVFNGFDDTETITNVASKHDGNTSPLTATEGKRQTNQ